MSFAALCWTQGNHGCSMCAMGYWRIVVGWQRAALKQRGERYDPTTRSFELRTA